MLLLAPSSSSSHHLLHCKSQFLQEVKWPLAEAVKRSKNRNCREGEGGRRGRGDIHASGDIRPSLIGPVGDGSTESLADLFVLVVWVHSAVHQVPAVSLFCYPVVCCKKEGESRKMGGRGSYSCMRSVTFLNRRMAASPIVKTTLLVNAICKTCAQRGKKKNKKERLVTAEI